MRPRFHDPATRRRTRRLPVLAAVAALAVLTAACGSDDDDDASAAATTSAPATSGEATNTTAGDPTPVKIAIAPGRLGFGLIELSADGLVGSFRDQNLDVELSYNNDTAQNVNTLLAGDVDVVVSNPVSLLTLNAQGQDVVALSAYTGVGLKLVAGSGVEAEPGDLSALEGKSVAAAGTYVQLALDLLLQDAGIDASSVTVVNASGADAVAALQAGQVDFVLANEPNPSNAIANGGKLVLDLNESDVTKDLQAGVIFAKRSWVDEHPDAAAGIIRAMGETYQFSREHPDEALDFAVQYIEPPDEAGFRSYAPAEIEQWVLAMSERSFDTQRSFLIDQGEFSDADAPSFDEAVWDQAPGIWAEFD